MAKRNMFRVSGRFNADYALSRFILLGLVVYIFFQALLYRKFSYHLIGMIHQSNRMLLIDTLSFD